MDETVFYYETSLSEALDIMKNGLPEARYVLDQWRQEYNCRRPQPTPPKQLRLRRLDSALGWHTPGAFAASLAAPAVGA